MEQLTIDTGLREYAVNGGPEHGGGVLRVILYEEQKRDD